MFVQIVSSLYPYRIRLVDPLHPCVVVYLNVKAIAVKNSEQKMIHDLKKLRHIRHKRIVNNS